MRVCGAARQPGTTWTASPRPALPAARWPPPPRLSWRTADRAFGQPSRGSSFAGRRRRAAREPARRPCRTDGTARGAGRCLHFAPPVHHGGGVSWPRVSAAAEATLVTRRRCRVPRAAFRVEPRGEGRRMWWRRDGHPHVRRQWCLVPRRRRAVWIKRRAAPSDGSTLGRRVFNVVSAPRGGIGWRGARDRRPLCPPLRLRPAGPPTRHRGPPRPPAGHTP